MDRVQKNNFTRYELDVFRFVNATEYEKQYVVHNRRGKRRLGDGMKP
jgi:hypothetical protein